MTRSGSPEIKGKVVYSSKVYRKNAQGIWEHYEDRWLVDDRYFAWKRYENGRFVAESRIDPETVYTYVQGKGRLVWNTHSSVIRYLFPWLPDKNVRTYPSSKDGKKVVIRESHDRNWSHQAFTRPGDSFPYLEIWFQNGVATLREERTQERGFTKARFSPPHPLPENTYNLVQIRKDIYRSLKEGLATRKTAQGDIVLRGLIADDYGFIVATWTGGGRPTTIKSNPLKIEGLNGGQSWTPQEWTASCYTYDSRAKTPVIAGQRLCGQGLTFQNGARFPQRLTIQIPLWVEDRSQVVYDADRHVLGYGSKAKGYVEFKDVPVIHVEEFSELSGTISEMLFFVQDRDITDIQTSPRYIKRSIP